MSKHHYANYLAKNNKVYFLNPVVKSKFNPFGQIDVELEKIDNNLIVVSYLNLLPKLNNLPKIIQKWIYKRQARQLRIAINKKIDIVWSFDPNRFYNQKVWGAGLCIYHTVDFHYTCKNEKEICKSSDYIFGVTPLVIETISNYSDKIYRVGHGADLDGFEIDKTIKVPGNNSIKACYIGNFHKQIDYGVLYTIATQNNNIDLILIGPTIDSNLSTGKQIDREIYNKLKILDNIYFIGSVPSNKLMSYLVKCDINLVLFKKEHEITHCSPHKLMAYFYSGNITLSNYIDEHKDTSSDIIIMEPDILKIPKIISEIAKDIEKVNSPKLKLKRKNFAKKNSYDNKITYISNIIQS